MIGELNKRATLQNPTNAKGASGGNEVSYATLASVWCSLKPVSEYGNREGSQDNQIARFKCVLRYSGAIKAGLSKDTMVTIDGINYGIEGMETDKKYITLKLSGTKNTL